MFEPIKYFDLPGPVLFDPPKKLSEHSVTVPVDFTWRFTLDIAPWVEVKICTNPEDN